MLYRAFKKYCDIHDIGQPMIAEWIGKSLSYVNNRLNDQKGTDGKRHCFTIDEVYIILEKAEIPIEEIAIYFPAGGRIGDNQSLEIQSNIIVLDDVKKSNLRPARTR